MIRERQALWAGKLRRSREAPKIKALSVADAVIEGPPLRL